MHLIPALCEFGLIILSAGFGAFQLYLARRIRRAVGDAELGRVNRHSPYDRDFRRLIATFQAKDGVRRSARPDFGSATRFRAPLGLGRRGPREGRLTRQSFV
jgi:hypothetical protein